MNKAGLYIVIEGVDLAGKSTIAKKLVDKLKDTIWAKDVYHTREPSNENYGKQMREVLFSKPILDEADEVKAAQLMLLDRLENTSTVSNKLREGAIVIQERNFLTALAYNEAGDTDEVKYIQECNKVTLKPDKLFFIDVNQNTIENRLKEREKESKLDAYEDLTLIMRRRASYLKYSEYIDHLFANNDNGDDDKIVDAMFKFITQKLTQEIKA
jgi:dTMP kinase